MGNNIQTDTLCPFPYTTANGSAPASVDDCTQTYAAANNPGYDILSAVLLASASFVLLLSLWRIVLLIRLTRQRRQTLMEHRSSEFILLGALFALAVLLESIDLGGFRGIAPVLYYLADEVCAATALSMGVVLVDFWTRLAKGAGTEAYGLPPWEKKLYVFMCYTNFLSWIIIGMSVPSIFNIAEGVKVLCGAGFCVWLTVNSVRSVRTLYFALQMWTTSSDMADKASPGRLAKRAARVLVRKYSVFIVVVILAFVVCLLDVSDSFSAPDVGWVVPVALDPVFVGLKVVWLIVLYVAAVFFRVPALRSSADGKPQESSSSTAKNNRHVVGANSVELDIVSVPPPLTPLASAASRKSKRTILRQDILETDGERHQKFHDFVSARAGGESVSAYDALVSYAQAESQAERDRRGREIIARFITVGAEEQILLPEAVQRELVELDSFAPDSFERVRRIAFQTLKENFLTAYLKWEEAQD